MKNILTIHCNGLSKGKKADGVKCHYMEIFQANFRPKKNFKTLDDIDSELVVGNWEAVKSDPSILYEDYVKVDQNVAVWGKATDVDITAHLAENNQADDGLSGNEENKEIQEKLLSSSSEAMVLVRELDAFLYVSLMQLFPAQWSFSEHT